MKRVMIPIEIVADRVLSFFDTINMGAILLANGYMDTERQYSKYDYLATQSGVHESKIRHIVANTVETRGVKQTHVEFATVDKLLCGMGQPMLWYVDPELRVYYDMLVPETQQCARPGCENEFDIRYKHSGAKKKYCSRACRDAAHGYRHGEHTVRALECRNGHPRTPENTAIRSGKKSCKVCEADNQRRYRRERKEVRSGTG